MKFWVKGNQRRNGKWTCMSRMIMTKCWTRTMMTEKGVKTGMTIKEQDSIPRNPKTVQQETRWNTWQRSSLNYASNSSLKHLVAVKMNQRARWCTFAAYSVSIGNKDGSASWAIAPHGWLV